MSLVSIIIPCYNAERWLSHAILSCLEQTYQPIEIIVIDDGSTDGSLDIIKSYDKVITWETGPNRGGNAARNRGFALSKGEYIQFLDADDYLLPEKIERQVQFLEETGADAVYGDWRHQFHKPDGTWVLGDVVVSSEQADLLAALLANWWTVPHSLLWRQSIVAKTGGWDLQLQAGQDRAFFLSAILVGAQVNYQSGCYTIYRRYPFHKTSRSFKQIWLRNHTQLLVRVEQQLESTGNLAQHYRSALAWSYFHMARRCYGVDKTLYTFLLHKTLSLCPDFRPSHSRSYVLLHDVVGFGMADWLVNQKRHLLKRK
jgi:glycosyltransferase involved in cell wall biosynthesis